MANYILIGRTGTTTITDGFRLNMEHDTYQPGASTPTEIARALDGSTVLSYGTSKKTWRFSAIVYATAATSYANITTVASWFSVATAADNLYKFTPVDDTTIYNVIIANKGEYAPELLTPVTAGTAAIWRVPIELIEQ